MTNNIQDIFNRIAPVYDQINFWLSLGQHHVWKLMTVKWSNPHLGHVGLDVCCGSGDLAVMLAKQVGITGKVIGVDFSCEQLAIARQRAANQSPHLNLSWVEADALNLPFTDNYFDCATMGYGLRNVPNIPLCLAELHRVLKPGAKAAILDFNRPNQAYMAAFQEWYLTNLVVPVAHNFGLTDEYAYIMESLTKFPIGSAQVNLAHQAGFTNAIHYSIAGGLMGVLVVTKS
jgi:demethylmenaquinone methyltransferase/2-methoxy-6-polyprenyl-1,4-benzoquinol methylase